MKGDQKCLLRRGVCVLAILQKKKKKKKPNLFAHKFELKYEVEWSRASESRRRRPARPMGIDRRNLFIDCKVFLVFSHSQMIENKQTNPVLIWCLRVFFQRQQA